MDRDLGLLNELELRLLFAINTHCHADHITGTGEIKVHACAVDACCGSIASSSGVRALEFIDSVEMCGLCVCALVRRHLHQSTIFRVIMQKRLPNVKSGISKASGAKADVLYEAGDSIQFGGQRLEVLLTPGAPLTLNVELNSFSVGVLQNRIRQTYKLCDLHQQPYGYGSEMPSRLQKLCSRKGSCCALLAAAASS